MTEKTDLIDFISNFDIRNNALQMRTLTRWNGRDLRTSENLAEHTHLVVACAIYLYEKYGTDCNFEQIIRLCMCHDSLELLRGDILSITKDAIPGLRQLVDNEEECFTSKLVPNLSDKEKDLVRLADLMACYMFIEFELRYPSNDYAYIAYEQTKESFNKEYFKFCNKYKISVDAITVDTTTRLTKGYENDAGVDVILDKNVTFLPHSTTAVELNVNVTPDEGNMAVLCARTSAASKGLNVAMCPIDADFTGNVTAIVHNISNNIIHYDVGTAFCQIVGLKLEKPVYSENVKVKRKGKRTDGKLGSTGGVK